MGESSLGMAVREVGREVNVDCVNEQKKIRILYFSLDTLIVVTILLKYMTVNLKKVLIKK